MVSAKRIRHFSAALRVSPLPSALTGQADGTTRPALVSLRSVACGLTQEEFAARYQIPLGTLRDWEQGAKKPDQAARAYLRAIAGDPAGVQRALHAPIRQPG